MYFGLQKLFYYYENVKKNVIPIIKNFNMYLFIFKQYMNI